MNKIYRIVWNKARRCLMVVAEFASSQGKGKSVGGAVIGAVAAAVLALGSPGEASATSSSTTEYLANGQDLLVGPNEAITVSGADAIVGDEVTANSISVSGTVSGTTSGIFLVQSTLTGGIKNATGGYISSIYNAGQVGNSGALFGIALSGSSIGAGITNSGLITAMNTTRRATGISLNGGATLTGGVSNTGRIEGNYSGIRVNSSELVGNLVNSGLINGVSQAAIAIVNARLDGQILNQSGGTLAGRTAGLYVYNGSISGAIDNAGTITGLTRGIHFISPH